MPAAITTVFHDQISRCRNCGNRIAWLRGRSGKMYPVNLLNTSSQGGRARVNDFHSCRNAGDPGDPQTQAAERAAAVAEARMEHRVPPPSINPSITARAIQARGMSVPPTLSEITDLRRTVSQAMDIYAVAFARYMVETRGATPQAAGSQYWSQMKLLVNDQIDGILSGYGTPAPARPVADNELDPPADPSTWTSPSVPATASLDAVVATTISKANPDPQGIHQLEDALSPDYAGGPEPVPADWTASDEDVPF